MINLYVKEQGQFLQTLTFVSDPADRRKKKSNPSVTLSIRNWRAPSGLSPPNLYGMRWRSFCGEQADNRQKYIPAPPPHRLPPPYPRHMTGQHMPQVKKSQSTVHFIRLETISCRQKNAQYCTDVPKEFLWDAASFCSTTFIIFFNLASTLPANPGCWWKRPTLECPCFKITQTQMILCVLQAVARCAHDEIAFDQLYSSLFPKLGHERTLLWFAWLDGSGCFVSFPMTNVQLDPSFE